MQLQTWDIFCKVVDNFGDAAVCWRLARTLAAEYGARVRVRLRIDELASLAMLEPRVQAVARQCVDGVEISNWEEAGVGTEPPDVVIEAFGCGLPDSCVRGLARRARAPLWIVLEYLSAEPWVRAHHRLPSPHPELGLQRYFFFPGFVQGTGGVLREAELFMRRDGYAEAQRAAFWQSVDQPAPSPAARTISVFGYEGAPLAELMRSWEEGPGHTVLAITQCALLSVVLDRFRASVRIDDRVIQRGALEIRVIPFLRQAHYDELLWSCDCNFVRGEDSFVRAQWAMRAFVWHVYPQKDCAHIPKLNAFLDLYGAGLPQAAQSAVSDMMHAWNQTGASGGAIGAAWAAYANHLDLLREHGALWAQRLAALGSLTENLVYFCRDKLK